MAKKKETGGFEMVVETVDEMQKELNELRSGRGGRTSKYEPIAKAAEDLAKGKAIKVVLGKNEVGGLRGYLNRHHGEKYDVKSSKLEDANGKDTGQYAAFVVRTADIAE